MTIRVLLADDQPLVRAGFRMILEDEDDIEVIAEAADGEEAVRLTRRLQPDVVLMDVRMPGTDGIEATGRIVAGSPGSRVLILTTFDLDEYVFGALRRGASGFLLKDAQPEDLAAAVRIVASGDAVVAARATRRLLDEFARHLPEPGPEPVAGLGRLTSREVEVLTQVARGLSNAEIAERLHVTKATVKSHVGSILAKLDLRDRVQAVVFAYRSGLEPRSGPDGNEH